MSGAQPTKCGKPSAPGCGAQSQRRNPDGISTTKACGNLAALAQQTSAHGHLHRTPATRFQPGGSSRGLASRPTSPAGITRIQTLWEHLIQYSLLGTILGCLLTPAPVRLTSETF